MLHVLSHLPVPERVERAFPNVEFVVVPTKGEIAADVHGEVLLTFAWGSMNLPEVVKHGVRWIHTIGTGVDRFPLDAVGDRLLTCARGANAGPIAEWALAVMLAHEKQLPQSWIHAPPERWNFAKLGELEGKTLGLVGMGTIAVEIARRALAFGMRVRAFRRSDRPAPLPGVECPVPLEDLLGSADHVVIATPLTPETRHIIGSESLAWLKPGAHLVNVARGQLVDQDALRVALDDERVSAASLDVCDPEPLPEGHWLYTHPRVRLSAHVSWSAPSAIDALFDSFVANLARYLADKPLLEPVDVEAGY